MLHEKDARGTEKNKTCSYRKTMLYSKDSGRRIEGSEAILNSKRSILSILNERRE